MRDLRSAPTCVPTRHPSRGGWDFSLPSGIESVYIGSFLLYRLTRIPRMPIRRSRRSMQARTNLSTPLHEFSSGSRNACEKGRFRVLTRYAVSVAALDGGAGDSPGDSPTLAPTGRRSAPGGVMVPPYKAGTVPSSRACADSRKWRSAKVWRRGARRRDACPPPVRYRARPSAWRWIDR